VEETNAAEADATAAWIAECLQAGCQEVLPRVRVAVETRIGPSWAKEEPA